MTSYTVPYGLQMAYSQPNVATRPPTANRPNSSYGQSPTRGYDGDICASWYGNVTGKIPDSSFEYVLDRAPPTRVEEKYVDANDPIATSEESKITINWSFGKKKKTVSAALLIALGVAGIVIG
jgi:hypothetical protein